MLRTIERPTMATLRPAFSAASSTCCTRCTCEEKQATMIRRSAWRNTLSIAGAMSRSGVVKPGHLGVGRVGEEEVDALLPQPGEGAQVGEPAVERQLVHLEVAGVQQGAARGAHGHGQRVGDRVVDRDELAVEDAELLAVPSRTPSVYGRDPVLLELGLDQRQGQRRADERDVGLERAAGRARRRCGPRGRG